MLSAISFNNVALSDFLISLAFACLTYRFWQGVKMNAGKIIKNFFYFSLFLSASFLFITLGDSLYNKWFLIVGLFLNMLGFAFLGELFFYIKFTKIPSKYGFFIISVLGIIVTLLIRFFPLVPFADPLTKSIIFTPHPVIGMLIWVIIIITTLPLFLTLIKQGYQLPPSEAKKKAYGLATIILLGLFISFVYSFSSQPFFGFSYQLPILTGIWTIVILFVAFKTRGLIS